jgi:hypothetical protein
LSLHGAFGREVLDDCGGEGIVHDPIGLGHGGHLAGQVVTAGVQGRDFFALFRFGAAGTLRVPAVCFELFLRNHLFCRLTNSMGARKSRADGGGESAWSFEGIGVRRVSKYVRNL